MLNSVQHILSYTCAAVLYDTWQLLVSVMSHGTDLSVVCVLMSLVLDWMCECSETSCWHPNGVGCL